MEQLTSTELIKIAHESPDLAKQIYKDQMASEAVQAWGEFQSKLQPVSKRGHVDHWNKRQGRYTPMYHYILFEDVKQHVNEAMLGTGLTWRQVPAVKVPVRVSLIDKRGNPTGGVTLGEAVGIKTIVMYKNGQPLTSGFMSTTSTSTSPKDVGSAATYCRRYSLCIATGISSVPDRDGHQGFNRPRRRFQPKPPMKRIQSNRPSYPMVNQAQVQQLMALCQQVAKKQNKTPLFVQQYISHIYANNRPIQQIPLSNFANVKTFLTKFAKTTA